MGLKEAFQEIEISSIYFIDLRIVQKSCFRSWNIYTSFEFISELETEMALKNYFFALLKTKKSSDISLSLDFTKASSMCQDGQGRCECHSLNLHAEGHFIQYDFPYNLFSSFRNIFFKLSLYFYCYSYILRVSNKHLWKYLKGKEKSVKKKRLESQVWLWETLLRRNSLFNCTIKKSSWMIQLTHYPFSEIHLMLHVSTCTIPHNLCARGMD